VVALIKLLIERFYDELWEQGREDCVPSILHADLSFKGSLGPEALDLGGYVSYLRSVRAGLSKYRCEILSLIADGPSAAAQIRFSGHHTGTFMGKAPTGRHISWQGAAFFKMRDELLYDIWVLGDVKSVELQLSEAQ
jgi:predicted ester cyclase